MADESQGKFTAEELVGLTRIW
jgi:hypothetical protein